MATPSVSSVYIHVVEDVISKVRDEFLSVGVGDNVLSELQGLWELKMMQCGVISGPIDRSSLPKTATAGPAAPVHDLNVPYEGTEEYETPTAEMLFPPTPLQTPIQTPLPGIENSLYQLPMGSNDFTPVNDTSRGGADVKGGRPSPYMQPPSPWMNQRPLGVDVNVAYVEGREEVDRGSSHQPMTQDFFMMSSGKRKRDDYASRFPPGGYIPQQDGAGDAILEVFELEVSTAKSSSNRYGGVTANGDMQSAQEARTAQRIPQQDGVHDGYDDFFNFPGVANEEFNTPVDHDLNAGHTVGTPKPAKNEGADDDEPPLNEDDDDDDLDDLEQGEEEPSTHHLVLAQFDKVTRTKNRWKCALKDGIMHINSKDILFNKANGEFDF
ncbi:uncharacterized protein LOC131252816 isoform X1 [Magnolia sinica]|uniref:uncharacterized protein LOC131252816 isoform X1 n=1 Tax=Magnolia sinica TaxID=86752 RepID=UPI00265A2927|nr:uncharacterized protein LOC131252816 isoform X1 [Magnolia sinica]